jgi:hypothetical protein
VRAAGARRARGMFGRPLEPTCRGGEARAFDLPAQAIAGSRDQVPLGRDRRIRPPGYHAVPARLGLPNPTRHCYNTSNTNRQNVGKRPKPFDQKNRG